MERRSVVVAVGGVARPGTPEPVDVLLDLGPHHPTSHGAIRLRVELDGDVVTRADPIIGHVHRGAEKLFEVRDYRQGLTLANRHDWLSAFTGEIGLALVVERMLGLEVPERATWLRTTLIELGRVLNHLAFLIPLACPDPRIAAASAVAHARHRVQAAMEQATGGRLHFMAARIGGLRVDVDDAWCDAVASAIEEVRRALPDLTAQVLTDERAAAGRGLGVVTPRTVRDYAMSGPAAHAAGCGPDLRIDDPGLAYGSLRHVLRRVQRSDGDATARLECLLDHVALSCDLVEATLAPLRSTRGEPVEVRLPKVLRVPEGIAYAATEGPLGISGYLLVSRGERTPWRLKLRTASFANAQALATIVPGTKIDDLALLLASMTLIAGDIDR